MIPKYEFDNSFDNSTIDPDRNVLNTKDVDDKVGLVIKTDKTARDEARSSHYDSVEFTDSSLNFNETFEDEDLISGKVKPTVVAHYENGCDGNSNIYDPFDDKLLGKGRVDIYDDTQGGTQKMYGGEPDIPKEAYGTSDFMKSKTDLLIASIALGTVVVLEIIILILLLK